MPKLWVRSESGEAFCISPSKATFRKALRKQFLARILQSHLCVEATELQDVHNAETWLDAYSATVVFGGDPRGVSLALTQRVLTLLLIVEMCIPRGPSCSPF